MSRKPNKNKGISRVTQKSPGGKLNEIYSVSWCPEPGVQKCSSFSIKKYGEERAFKLAVAYRKRMMKKSYTASELKQIESRIRDC